MYTRVNVVIMHRGKFRTTVANYLALGMVGGWAIGTLPTVGLPTPLFIVVLVAGLMFWYIALNRLIDRTLEHHQVCPIRFVREEGAVTPLTVCSNHGVLGGASAFLAHALFPDLPVESSPPSP